MQDKKHTNEWISWIESAIAKEYFKYYEYRNFSNIQEIGFGKLGTVFRANCKDLEESTLRESMKRRKLFDPTPYKSVSKNLKAHAVSDAPTIMKHMISEYNVGS